MAFDACEERVRQVAIKAAIEIRRIMGLPVEDDVTVLLSEVSQVLGISVKSISSRDVNHAPELHEMIHPKTNMPVIERHDCIACGSPGSVILYSLCPSCIDSEGGRYKTTWKCSQCGNQKKSEKFFTQWMREMEIDIGDGSKTHLGIMTITDDGIK